MRYNFRLMRAHFFCFLWASICFGQTGRYTRYTSFMPKDGLPSSCVYRTLEDDKGFLWIATNAGVARFDGKYFQVFTTKDGLPDNEVFSFSKETNGRIWVECFNQIPAYFDEIQNRFVVPSLDSKIAADMTNTLGINLNSLPKGGISYSNRNNYVVFKNAEPQPPNPVTEKLFAPNVVDEYGDGSVLVTSGIPYNRDRRQYKLNLYHIKGKKILESISIVQGESMESKRSYQGGMRAYCGNFYLGFRYSDEFYIYTEIRMNPIRWKTHRVKVPERYINYYLTPDRLAFVAESGKIYVYNINTLQLTHTISDGYLTNSYFNDSKGNEWVSTIDRGLVAYRNQPLQSLKMPKHFSNTSFMSTTRKEDGTLLAGNYYGEVVETKNGKTVVHKVIKKSPARIRKIMAVGDNVYTFSEEGIYRNYKERLPDPSFADLSFAKVAISYNDTIILIGTHRNLLLLNTRTHKLQELMLTMKRTTALAKARGDVVYFGSTDGLYKYDCKKRDFVSLSGISKKLKGRISALCYTNDGLLWVGTSNNGVLAIKNDKIVLNIFTNDGIDGSAKNITAGRPGQVWASTSNGINVIHYKWKSGKLVYTTRNISVSDGLASNEVEEIFYQDGYIYAATSNGISVIPENYIAPEINIPTYLVRMTINQKDCIISDHYQLKYGQQDLQMQFAGVDLNGYFGHLQYQLDQHEAWIDLDQNTLAIQLSTGKHVLKVRAVDVSGNISNKILMLHFDVTVPFWQNIWFWIAFGALIQIILFFVISRYLRRKKEAKLEQKIARVQSAAIEQQAFTSLMNPHFIFNALNSVQHYINVRDRKSANRYLSDFASLIRKSFDAAQQSFIPLEEEIENIKIYLNLELMRFEGCFKYEIHVDDRLEVEDWMIPTMVLQPLLENALLHGIMPSIIQSEISIQFKLYEHDLLIVITDNGIGLENSHSLKGHTAHKSRGMELISKRIKALSHFGPKPISLTMQPAFDNVTNPGNKVTLLIPEALYEFWRGDKQT